MCNRAFNLQTCHRMQTLAVCFNCVADKGYITILRMPGLRIWIHWKPCTHLVSGFFYSFCLMPTLV